jgi:regulator of ribonuclease activity A
MISFATTDLCDAHEALLADGSLSVLHPGYQWFGGAKSFAGRARTLQVFEDNALVRSRLEEQGEGQVLVIDGGASLRYALVGGILAGLAARNGWVGILVHGAVRDASEIDQCPIGVCALGLSPRRSSKRGAGQGDAAVQIASARIHPGDWVYADRDGIVVSRTPLHN